MIDTNRLRLARDADYETGTTLCRQGADDIDLLLAVLKDIYDNGLEFGGAGCVAIATKFVSQQLGEKP